MAKLHGFSAEGARRVVEATRRVEQQARPGTSPGRAKYPVGVGGGAGLVRVRATGTITARSGGTPGTGAGVRVSFNGTSYSDITGAISLKNPFACTLTSGWYGWAKPYGGTTYEIVSLG